MVQCQPRTKQNHVPKLSDNADRLQCGKTDDSFVICGTTDDSYANCGTTDYIYANCGTPDE